MGSYPTSPNKRTTMTKTYNLSSFNYDKIKVNSSYGDRSKYFVDCYQIQYDYKNINLEDYWEKGDEELPKGLSIERIFLANNDIQFEEDSLIFNMSYAGGSNRMRMPIRYLFFYYKNWDKQLIIPGYFPGFNDRIIKIFLRIFSPLDFRLLVKKVNEFYEG